MEKVDTKAETKTEAMGCEKVMAKIKEILRYQKRVYYLRSAWQGFVKMDDTLETQPTKELKAQIKDFEYALGEEPKNFEEETWEGEKYIRLIWHVAQEETPKRYEGKRDRITDRKRGGGRRRQIQKGNSQIEEGKGERRERRTDEAGIEARTCKVRGRYVPHAKVHP